jgi:hypothetical protein
MEILLAEDVDPDAELTLRALENAIRLASAG